MLKLQADRTLAVVAGICVGLLAPTVLADVIHVHPGDSIQAAINAASDGDEIIVHPGWYAENISFHGKAIWLHSASGPSLTTISHPGPEPGRVVVCISGEGPGSVLQGFRITGGQYDHGAGMYIKNSSPTVTHCWFIGNSATYHAAGMDIFQCSSPPTVTNCRFVQNTAAYDGGALRVQNGTAILTDCVFIANTSGQYGAAIYNELSSPEVTNCTIRENTSPSGGGMYNYQSSPTISDSTFCENSPDNIVGDWIDGGGNCLAVSCADLNGNGIPDECDPCPADLNGDRIVDVIDLLHLLAEWGHSGVPADINGDGVVDVLDLLEVLAAWGPCA